MAYAVCMKEALLWKKFLNIRNKPNYHAIDRIDEAKNLEFVEGKIIEIGMQLRGVRGRIGEASLPKINRMFANEI